MVEDNPANQLLARAVLERDGFTVEVADSAASTLLSLTEHRPDLILMDIQLPGEDGLALTREIKSLPATAEIPVVALSAHVMAGHQEEALAAGCAGYITKPIDTRTFVDQVKAFLAGTPAQLGSANHSSGGNLS